MKIGVDYYPEQWDRELWEQDADLMVQSGVRIVRMAEFAWSRMEPEEGRFEFGWLDEAVRIFADRGMDVFLCTPTSTPPLWAFEKYPEIIQVNRDGNKIPLGIRGHRCLNSPRYRELSARIITKMVERYAKEPAVIGYQIDNELEANHCCCPVCEETFRKWIIDKYKTVDSVNQAYGNSVWSGEYSSFQLVKPPAGPFGKWLNPSFTLDFNRYASDSTVDYVRFQTELIRTTNPGTLVTTNTWLCENMPDFYQLFEDLDFVSYDNYPVTRIPEDSEKLYSHAFHLDLMRGMKEKNFWIMEQLSGSMGSWMPMEPTPRPGMIKGYSLQAFAHGADAVLHFRWRSAVSGAEMYWHGIIDQSNVPGRRFREFADLCDTVNQLDEIKGTKVINQVALLYSSEHEYGFKLQHQAAGMYYLEQLKALHDGFTSIGVGVDIVNQTADLSAYDIVLAPTMYIDQEAVTQSLYRFAEQGGSLVITNRSGVKDSHNQCIMEPLPGKFARLTGVHVTEYDPIGERKQSLEIIEEQWKEQYRDTRKNQMLNRYNDSPQDQKMRTSCTRWCDLLEVDTASVIAEYGDEFYQGIPAVTENLYGEGSVYYIGTVLSRAMYITMAKVLAKRNNIAYFNNLPLGVEITYREKEEKRWEFIFNNTEKSKEFLLHGESIQMQPFEMVIRIA